METLILISVIALALFISIGIVALVWDTTVQWIKETKDKKQWKEN
jgi:hypothetical protein